MIWSDWNKADKTLLLALVVFFFSLCVHLQYPHSVVADGMLFCAEAALVGGIADWFAVTALFRKPRGFPYHTAISAESPAGLHRCIGDDGAEGILFPA